MITFQRLDNLERNLSNPESELSQRPISLDGKVFLYFVEDDLGILREYIELLGDISRFKYGTPVENYVDVVAPDSKTTIEDIIGVVSPESLKKIIEGGARQVYCLLDNNLTSISGGKESSGFQIASKILQAKMKPGNESLTQVSIIGASDSSFPQLSDNNGNPIFLVDNDSTKDNLYKYMK